MASLGMPASMRGMPSPRALLTVLAIITAGLVAGCTSKPAPTESLPTASTLLVESATAMRNVQTAHVRIGTEGEVSALPLRRAEGDLLRSGDSKGTIQISQFGVLIEYEFVVVGDTIYLKGVTGGWQKLPAATAAA